MIIPGYNTDIDQTISGMFVKPTDTSEDRLMLSVHYYDPYEFTLEETGTATWGSNDEITHINDQFSSISIFANALNMPVIISEYGAIDKDNLDYRLIYLEQLNTTANSFNIVTAYWDNGYDGPNGFALFNRTNNIVTDVGEILISVIVG